MVKKIINKPWQVNFIYWFFNRKYYTFFVLQKKKKKQGTIRGKEMVDEAFLLKEVQPL